MSTQPFTEFLNRNYVDHVLLIHRPAETSQDVAASMHLPGRYLAKAVVVRIDGRLALAVVPATRSVDFERLAGAVGASEVRLADEWEFSHQFSDSHLGTIPPVGALFGMETYVDPEISTHENIVIGCGTRTEAVAISFRDYCRLAQPRLRHIAANSDQSAVVNSYRFERTPL